MYPDGKPASNLSLTLDVFHISTGDSLHTEDVILDTDGEALFTVPALPSHVDTARIEVNEMKEHLPKLCSESKLIFLFPGLIVS